MRKIILSTAIIFFGLFGAAQLKFQGSIIAGPSANKVDVVLKPTANFTGYLTNVIVVIQIPQGVTQPVITPTSLSTYFAAFTPFVPITSGGYVNYQFNASNTTVTTNTTVASGVEYPTLRLTFSGGPVSPLTSIRLANLASGGPGTQYQFYVEANASSGANDYTNYVKMFYGAITSPAAPYSDEATGYANYQYVQQTAALPIKLIGFTATKKDKDAVLTWMVENQDANASGFEIERSFNAIDFSKIGSVDVNLNTGSSATYNFTDANIASAKSSGIIYYRIKQTNKDGKFVYTEIRNIKLDDKAFGLNLFPNPAKNYTNIIIDLLEASPISIHITDGGGKEIKKVEVAGFKGVNQNRIDLSGFSSGSYLVKVYTADQSQTISLVKAE